VSLRILFLTHRLPYAPNRGDRLRAFHMLHTMVRQAAVDLVSLVHDEEEASHAAELRGLVSSLEIAPVPHWRNRALAAVQLATARPMTHLLLDSPALRPQFDRLVRDRRPDVVFAYCSSMVRFAMAPPLAGIPCLLDMVDADSAKWRTLGNGHAGPKGYIYRREARCLSRFEVDAMRHAHATLVVNERERDLLLDLAPDAPVQVMENGVDLERFVPANGPAPHPTVVFCGVMNYGPNEEGARWLAQEVWPLVRAARPDAALQIVGASPTPAVQALGQASANVTVTGAVPDVRPYLWNAAVAVAPLLVARGVQNKVLEAVAAGLPCIVTPPVAEGLPETLRSACPVGATPAEFARALLELLAATPDERRARARTANLQGLTWPHRLAGLVPLLQDAAQARTTRVGPAGS
jgi:polysaccharide biosynthesis protein PslH